MQVKLSSNFIKRSFQFFGVLVGVLAIYLSFVYTNSRENAIMNETFFLNLEDQSVQQNMNEVFPIRDLYVLPQTDSEWITSDPVKKIKSLNEYIEHMYGAEWVFFHKMKQTSFTYENVDVHADLSWKNMNYSVADNQTGAFCYQFQSPGISKIFLDSNFASGTATFSYANAEEKEVIINAPKTYYIGDTDLSDFFDVKFEVTGSGSYGLELYTFDENLFLQFMEMINGKAVVMEWRNDTAQCLINVAEESFAILPKFLADPKWRVIVNNEEVETKIFNRVLEIPLVAGYNQIYVQYAPKQLKIIKFIFVCPVICFCIPGFIKLIIKYRKKKKIRAHGDFSLKSHLKGKVFVPINVEKRNINWDIVRCIAVYFVVSVHFFLRTGFYETKLEGNVIFVATTFRNLFMSCVPLFLLLSGCTMIRKKLSSRYYFGLVKTLSIFVLSILAHYVYIGVICHGKVTLYQIFSSIIHYELYSWYVEMYIGLFLLIPFLNIVYWNLNRKQKKLLIITLVFLTALPGSVNWFDWTRIDTFARPFLNKAYTYPLPDWWTRIYPLTYYFIGAYINEYKDDLKLSKFMNLLLIILNTVLATAYLFYRANHGVIIAGPWTDYNGTTNVINASLILAFVLRIDTKKFPIYIKKCFAIVSKLSFGAYLVSYTFDIRNYPKLIQSVPDVISRMKYYFAIVPFDFVCALLLSAVLYFIYDFICGICEYYFKYEEN